MTEAGRGVKPDDRHPIRKDAVRKGSGTAGGLRVGLVAAAAAVGLAACSSPAGSRPPRTTLPATTTTLPAPILVGGTGPSGSMAFLGSVMRVAVPQLPVGIPAAGASGTSGTSGASTGPSGDSGTPPPARQTVTVAFRQFGSGPDLVLVMGQSGSMSWWEASLLQDLTPHYRVTLFDLPGVGWSGPAPAGFTPSIEAYADVTAGLLDTLGLHRPMLVGWGMGGEVAMEVGLRHPGSASRLVLVDTSAGGPGAAPTPASVAATLASPASTPAGLGRLLFPAHDSGDRAAWLLDLLQQGPDDVVASALAGQAGAQASWWRNGASNAELSAISLPTMVVWGSADSVFPAADGSALASAIPGARAVTLAGAAYASLFQAPATFVADLQAFASSPS